METVRSFLQKRGLNALAKQGEPKFTDTWFPYTSGEVGPYYIQSTAIEEDGADYHQAIDDICRLVEETAGLDNFDAISGGESRDWDFSNPAAAKLAKPHIKIYKDGKVCGAKIEGRRVVHIADLNNEGSSMRDKWHPAVKNGGGRIVYAFFYVDRMEDGVKVMDKLGIPSGSVVPMDEDAWKFLMEKGYITSKLYESLCSRMRDKRAWAHNALRAHTGKLEEMLGGKDAAKAVKILDKGYPELRDELLEKMGVSQEEYKRISSPGGGRGV